MHNKKNIKITVSLSILIAVNLLFINKYLSRITEFAWAGTLLMLIIYILLRAGKDKITFSERGYYWMNRLIILLFFIFAVISFKIVSPESLIVDRWSVISTFWEAVFNRVYPYSALSHLGNIPGPMPVYFILALPFYLVGEIGYMTIFGLLLFLLLVNKLKITSALKLWSTLFLTGSAFLWWETICRSTIFFNSVIVLACILWFHGREKHEGGKSFYFQAAVIGLALSTRSILAIPVIISFFAAFRRNEISMKNLIISVLIATLIFCLTFLPVILFFPDRFPENNPFLTQSTYLMPLGLSAGFIILSAGLSLPGKSATDDIFYSGLALFITIAGYFLFKLLENGITMAYYGSSADISYFYILCSVLTVLCCGTGNDRRKGEWEKG